MPVYEPAMVGVGIAGIRKCPSWKDQKIPDLGSRGCHALWREENVCRLRLRIAVEHHARYT